MNIVWIILFLLGGYAILYVINWIVAAGINKGAGAADNAVRRALDKSGQKEPEKLADRFRDQPADEDGQQKE